MSIPATTVPVVGVGASAGGLEALREVFQAYSEDTGLAFVVVPHLDPTHESLMAQLIERYTKMDVRQAEGGEELKADSVYVIPPGHGLAIEDGILVLTEFSDPRGQRRPIDDFFESLATACEDMAACVILSGTGADGSRGLRAIKENGGLAIAQDPATARYDGMPVSAISTGLVDIVAEPASIIETLRDFFSRSGQSNRVNEAAAVTDHIDDLCEVLREAVGHDFSRYKRTTMTRRVARRMQVLSIDNAADYVARIRSDEDECRALFQDLLINVTQFFRDEDEFGALQKQAIEKLVTEARDGQEIRIWVAGASSGEEAYTIAILFAEAMRQQEKRPYIQIFATDIDDKMLDIARSATYPLSALADIPVEYQHRYVIGNPDTFSMVPQIRDMVRFSLHNLVRDPPFSKISLVSCRNLLIYFDDVLQKQVLPLFHFALRDSGYLFLGTSEGIGRFEDLFDTVDQRAKIFRRKNVKSQYSLQIGHQTTPVYARRRQRVSASAEQEDIPSGSTEIAALRRVAERYAPVSFLVDEEGLLLQKWGAAGKFLEFPDRNERNLHVPTLARPGLREAVGPLLRKTVEGQNRTVSRGLEITTEFGKIEVSVLCEPVDSGGYLIVIKETGQLEPFDVDEADEFDPGEGQLQFLEEELQNTRYRLRSTVEELETTNEELKSSNEEMMSMNEELQSTNEELTTVNDELKTKVDQVTVANADIKNFFDTTELIVLVVDAEMNLRSFTDAAMDVFPIDKRDIGRPLSDLPTKLDSNDYLMAAMTAASDGQTTQYRTAATDGDSDYIARIIPYRRMDGTIEGATLVFTDVTEALRLERELREERERLRLALEVAKVGIWEYEPSSDITVLDATERSLLDLGEDEGDRMEPILARMSGEDRDRINAALRRAMDGTMDFDETFRIPLREGGHRWLHGLGRRIINGDTRKFIGVTYDITAERQLLEERELLLREMNHRVKNLFAIIAAMVMLVRRESTDLDEFAEALRSRIYALGRSHALTSNSQLTSDSVSLRDLVMTVLEPSMGEQDVTVDGPEVEIPVKRLTSVAMILYEWTTNATKYGALSLPSGKLAIGWTHEGEELELSWRETGGEGAGGSDSGFGTKLVEVTTRQLNGEVSGKKTKQGFKRSLKFAL
ncbi:chemotaxis protein CheB [Paraurantiacibacter namhicola]|uniref:Chemotaxis protein methyltransferase n=1 Tax=Paraurantiacibacter namhicola TaxID=645517 RepID=A0A1C7D6S3_9SPHN|nr:chemotaxis protein CheB [Paraurantiacibacter namhicola]ANU07052.1 Chemotaxis protein methyltransferase [Paraurantiacibacter namhicola]